MYKHTNPILEVIQETDRILANTFKKIAIALAKRGNVQGSKDYYKRWSEALRHAKQTKEEIEKNAREAEQSLAVWNPEGRSGEGGRRETFIDGSYLGFAQPTEDQEKRQDNKYRDRSFNTDGVHGLLSK